ncbi:MAG: DUF4160 domain-containing protein [Synechocystis sp.]|jgi:hypothetical protein
MPTIFRQDGYCIRIYPNGHSPAHVHVIKGTGQAKIEISLDATKPKLLLVQGMTQKEAKQALTLVEENTAVLLEKWKEIHG